MKIEDIVVKNRHREELGDIKSLAESIDSIGLLHPPVVEENSNELIAGYRRIKACVRLGWDDIPVRKINIENGIEGEFDENEERKDFTVSEKVTIAKKLLPKEQKKAKKRQAKGKENLPNVDSSPEKFSELEEGRAKDKIAKTFDWSRPSLDKALKIDEAAKDDPAEFGDLEEKMEDSVHSAYNELKRRKEKKERKEKTRNLPELKNLFMGDCLEKVSEISDNSIDALIMDPPFGIGEETGSRTTTQELRQEEWGYDGDDDTVFPLLEELFKRLESKLKSDSHLYIFTSWKAWHRLYPVVDKFFEVSNWLGYLHYLATGGHFSGYRGGLSSIMFAVNGEERRISGDGWNFFDVSGSRRKEPDHHPAQKSVEICKRLIENSTVEGETVLDPFAGSGSTLVAAEKLNRNWIGIEKEPRWHEVAKSRVLEVKNNA